MTNGPTPKGFNKGCAITIILSVIVIGILVKTCSNEPKSTLTKKEIHQQNIEKLFSGWDGSHIKLTEQIKEALNDPNSYEHIETRYKDMDSFLTVYSTFTAKNGFGGTLKKEVIVTSDTLGNIIEVLKWID
ncbi:hypothetical protein ACFSKN_01545 [Mariniflexile gromovii]|uniref:Uncharacterized protein n=1 Tax=Mariniflexile gromovii TaxID=362523 RepID=A0ABS4BSL6_9FLAO|nr:hypothetical protein [Mariniflexile gromovii]MBP0903561.1 hypothetical protein [Mariniflexile gromovii]